MDGTEHKEKPEKIEATRDASYLGAAIDALLYLIFVE